ncbi:hypothetical protein KUL72_31280 [Bradyrhizobium arachidis]|uniref:hypothetical protein n=1 Tax=Bradyrhizobium arachidis TaxID=858423 RepID=UPI0021625C8A|nr:hypothetical protein [Bradyrhizobium arachidis]UVO35794.1 hypothetical protein KUL72_31280 [Bradyrhizobium arachidis]
MIDIELELLRRAIRRGEDTSRFWQGTRDSAAVEALPVIANSSELTWPFAKRMIIRKTK